MTAFPDKYPDNPFDLNNFGIGYLNVREAAILVTKCMFLNGAIEADYNRYDGISLYAPGLDKALENHIVETERRLVEGIKQGTLKPDQISRTLDESIISEETYIADGVLVGWLEERNTYLGEPYQEYVDEQVKIIEAVLATVQTVREKHRNPTLYEEYKKTHESDETFGLVARIEELERELATYKNQKNTKPEKPLKARERGTLLKLIIGMAIDKYRFDPTAAKSSAATNIMGGLDRAGIKMDDDTIRGKLQEAAELLDNESA